MAYNGEESRKQVDPAESVVRSLWAEGTCDPDSATSTGSAIERRVFPNVLTHGSSSRTMTQ